MKIKEIYIDGYKNLYNTTIKFNKITTLIGINNYGKTNFMEVLNNFQNLISDDESYLFFRNFSYNKNQDENKIVLKIIYERDNLDELEYYIEFTQINQNERSIKEILKIKEINTIKYKTLFSREGLNIKYRTDLSSDRLNQESSLFKKDGELALKKLLYIDNISFRSVFNEIVSFKIPYIILNKEIKIKGTYLNTDNSVSIVDGGGFEKLLYLLKEKNKESFDLLNNIFKKLIPSIGKIDVEKITSNLLDDRLEEEETYFVYVHEKNNRKVSSFSKMSDGSKRIYILLLLTIYFKIVKTPVMILFEELENAIHPKLFEELIEVLEEINSNGQIVITSHSPFLVQYVGLENINIGIPNKKGLAIFKNLNKKDIKKIEKYAAAEEISEGEFLFNLMLEDIEDNNDLKDFFQEEKLWKKL